MRFLPFVLFWVLLFLGRSDLGLKGVVLSIAIWAGLLVGFLALALPWYLFVIPQTLLDIVLLLVVLGRDVRMTLR